MYQLTAAISASTVDSLAAAVALLATRPPSLHLHCFTTYLRLGHRSLLHLSRPLLLLWLLPGLAYTSAPWQWPLALLGLLGLPLTRVITHWFGETTASLEDCPNHREICFRLECNVKSICRKKMCIERLQIRCGDINFDTRQPLAAGVSRGAGIRSRCPAFPALGILETASSRRTASPLYLSHLWLRARGSLCPSFCPS